MRTQALLRDFAVEGERDAGWFQPGDLVVVPSRSEMACLTAQEAMARGAVVIASRVGDLEEIIEDGRSGLVVEAGDVPQLRATIEQALRMPEDDFLTLARAGRARARERAGAWQGAFVSFLSRNDAHRQGSDGLVESRARTS